MADGAGAVLGARNLEAAGSKGTGWAGHSRRGVCCVFAPPPREERGSFHPTGWLTLTKPKAAATIVRSATVSSQVRKEAAPRYLGAGPVQSYHLGPGIARSWLGPISEALVSLGAGLARSDIGPGVLCRT